MLDVRKVLVLAPHTDDGELGCGGTVARLVEEGAAVTYVAFSICETSVRPEFPSDILAREVQAATQTLGIAAENLIIYRYPVRHFPQYRQELLESLVSLRNALNPDLVLLPAADDVHQDHQTITQEGIRAFKHTTILGYELPWNNLNFAGAAFVGLTDRYLDRKIAALRAYLSQQHRDYFSEDLIRGLARVRGQQAGQRYAEAFQLIRWLIP
ncbi:MAG: PIG-L deacetylase family protein [Chloroflexota bacterium]